MKALRQGVAHILSLLKKSMSRSIIRVQVNTEGLEQKSMKFPSARSR